MGVGGCFFCLFSLRQRKRGRNVSFLCAKEKEDKKGLFFAPKNERG
jgi:hypothetical protein